MEFRSSRLGLDNYAASIGIRSTSHLRRFYETDSIHRSIRTWRISRLTLLSSTATFTGGRVVWTSRHLRRPSATADRNAKQRATRKCADEFGLHLVPFAAQRMDRQWSRCIGLPDSVYAANLQFPNNQISELCNKRSADRMVI